jgi:hypothetical protein
LKKKRRGNLTVVPKDPFEDPIPWLKGATQEIEDKKRKNRRMGKKPKPL